MFEFLKKKGKEADLPAVPEGAAAAGGAIPQGYINEVKNKTPLTQLTVEGFVTELSSKASVPGGGGTAALVGALAAALGGMVANLTIGMPKYAGVEEEMRSLRVAVYRVQKDLLDLIEKDAQNFAPLAGAARMKCRSFEEQAEKERVVQACLKRATDAPLEIIHKCCEAVILLKALSKKGSTLAVSDAACGAVLAGAAMQAAWLNVCMNTRLINDEAYTQRVNGEAQMLLKKYLPATAAVFKEVEEKLTNKHG
ncbi:MAG: cyclodeaminase/cyclohydrolase family protein [Clostridiales Family XIII bacterium]|jgi:formiminotetrahydrofolate cyclodeaminase|nr:cyclodeaminase/cyclohydrolase family protein [Clostridiales Family XIII bacterium]